MDEEDTQLVVGATYVDTQGKCVRVTRIEQTGVCWIDIAGGSTGSTELMQFVRHFHRTREPDLAA